MTELEAVLRRALRGPLPGPAAQSRFAPSPVRQGWAPDLLPRTARRAAALLLIHPGPAGPALPLTVRRTDLPHHPGQVSLPGGSIDPGESVEAAALREAQEEIGVAPEAVRLLGRLSTLWIAVSNFVVHPIVGMTDATPGFRPHPGEVAQLIEVPVSDVRDPGRLHWTRRMHETVELDYPYFDLGGQVVWGATAMILGEFACLFDAAHGPAPPGSQAVD
jgi:8-oxo-dGTP pyrophosphatase MutT (NUDIX family)